MSKCNGCPRPATGAENRAYNREVERRGGPNSPGGRAYINSEHQKFVRGVAHHNRQVHGGCAAITAALLTAAGAVGWAAVDVISRVVA